MNFGTLKQLIPKSVLMWVEHIWFSDLGHVFLTVQCLSDHDIQFCLLTCVTQAQFVL